MLTIVPIKPYQIPEAKAIIAGVAQRIYEPGSSPESFLEYLERESILKDMDNLQDYYDGQSGLFLVVMDDGKAVGTGAVRRFEGEIAELKRIWLLEQYHGQGIGYRMVTQLFEFARQRGYKSIRLQTGSEQKRAYDFYKKLGFVEIPSYNDDDDNISMEISV